MNVKIESHTAVFEGALDEEVVYQDLQASFAKLNLKEESSVVSLDFSRVTKGNSSGIVLWLRFLKTVAFPFKYVHTPVWMVAQFNMVNGYFGKTGAVESFQVPFYCEELDELIGVEVQLGKEIPLQKSYVGFQMPPVERNGHIYHMDFVPTKLLKFLVDNHDQIQSVLKK